jgi:hypothetical protein
MEGMSCYFDHGDIHAIIKINFPSKALNKAKAENKTPEEFYSLSLKRKTGIDTLVDSENEHSRHLCVLIFQHTKILDTMLDKLTDFHMQFWSKFSGLN